MKGFQRTRTKAQDLTEIVFKQDGFLTGLNLDSPKSDVGDTQLTELKNCIPYRDRVEARGGLKPQTGYLEKSSTKDALVYKTFADVFRPWENSPFYDSEFDEFFRLNGLKNYPNSTVENYGKEDLDVTPCYNYAIYNNAIAPVVHDYRRLKDAVFFCTVDNDFKNNIIDKDSDRTDYFLRPLTSDTSSAVNGNIDTTATGRFKYGFLISFVRIVDGVVKAESNIVG